MILVLIPVLGWIHYLVVLGLCKGDPRENKYGNLKPIRIDLLFNYLVFGGNYSMPTYSDLVKKK